MGDVNGDGYPDIVLACMTSTLLGGPMPNQLYLNKGKQAPGRFVNASHLLPPHKAKSTDAVLSDFDGDGLLDRHYGFDSYIGSGAWETNHMSGGKGKDHWTYFTKIVAAPADAYVDGTEIGPQIWGAFATIQEVESGSGVIYLSPAGPGLGNW